MTTIDILLITLPCFALVLSVRTWWKLRFLRKEYREMLSKQREMLNTFKMLGGD